MVPPDPAAYEQARRKVATLVENPAESRSLVPAVVGLLDHEDRHLRLSAACGVCLVATADPDLLSYLFRRLVDRLHDDDARPEVVFAFEYLLTQYPERADEILQGIREDDGREPLAYDRDGGFRRSNIYSPSAGDRGVGRARVAGSGRDPGPQQVYSDDADIEEERRKREDETDPQADAGAETDEASEGSDAPDADPDGSNEADDSDDEDGTVGESGDAGRSRSTGDDEVSSEIIAALLDGPVFDDVTLRSADVEGRFADHYRLLGIVRGRETAVDLRVFRYPQRGRTRFVDRLARALETWQALDEDGVVPCYDWGADPRPWAAVNYTGSTLADRGGFRPAVALNHAVTIVGTVARLHAAGVVHGGLEPRSITYTDEADEPAVETPPRIDDVGVLEAFRYPFDPATVLDPRYAAPEYFEDSYGAVDHATDIYHLGAVCYRLFTGRPPYAVDPGAARERVLGAPPPTPSEAEETVPGIVDEVIRKAMARQKLTRYESAAQMEQDLLRVRDQFSTDG